MSFEIAVYEAETLPASHRKKRANAGARSAPDGKFRWISGIDEMLREPRRDRGAMQFSENLETSETSESMLRCETEFLDAGFERGRLHVEKRRGPVCPPDSPVALLDGLSNDRKLGLIE
jgi:hypothetical protein